MASVSLIGSSATLLAKINEILLGPYLNDFFVYLLIFLEINAFLYPILISKNCLSSFVTKVEPLKRN